MNVHQRRAGGGRSKAHSRTLRPEFECIALLLQGGGALGAYQAGVYQGLAEANLHPDWVAGISIGGINSAIIAGNAPEARVAKLRQFWDLLSSRPLCPWPLFEPGNQPAGPPNWAAASTLDGARDLWASLLRGPFTSFGLDGSLGFRGDFARSALGRASAAVAATLGAPGFFSPRGLSPWLQPGGAIEATSYYDTSIMKSTLERFVDFDRINSNETRFSVGAVNVETGNFVYFDNTTHTIGPEHVMASGALPPGFPAVEIEGEHYWDGGLVSNTPLQWVLESEPRQDTLAFQVDLWSARGPFPRGMAEVETRQKEIQYSSRTRAGSDRFRHGQKVRNSLATLLSQLPAELRDAPEHNLLRQVAERKLYSIVQLIYRSKQYEGGSKDYEFSRSSMEDHWRAGYNDTVRTLRHPEIFERPTSVDGVCTFDLAVNGRE